MCDDTTEAENVAYLARRRLSRRAVGVGTTAAVAASVSGCSAAPRSSSAEVAVEGPASATSNVMPTGSSDALKRRRVVIPTPDGEAEAFFVAPERGRHPGVLMWPDVAGLRTAYETMAARLAAAGYAVVSVNPYYRSSRLPIFGTIAEWRTDAGRAKARPMIAALTPARIARDGAAFVAWLDAQSEVDENRLIGTCGYCMSGSFTFRTAAAVPDRVGVIASFHGGGLVTEEDRSPHRLFGDMRAAALVCIAENDDARDPEAKRALRRAADDAGITAEIEVYPAPHGWCTIDAPIYDEEEAERAGARWRDHLKRYLTPA
ncbi:MAG: dienelactone hydrolase family protein [Myxococcota bacterium]